MNDLRKDTKKLQGIPGKEKNVEWSSNDRTSSSTETEWKEYRLDPQLDHAAGDYEPLQHREKMRTSVKPKSNWIHSNTLSCPLLRDVSISPPSADQMDDTLHLLMQEELYGTEGFDQH